MKRLSQLFTIAAITTLFTGGALAGTSHNSNEQNANAGDKGTTVVQKHSVKDHNATKPFPKYAWERGAILELMQAKNKADEGATKPVMKHPWERGEMLKLLQEKGIGQSSADFIQASPPVVIYFDSTASELGHPLDLNNTHTGRSIKLKYLKQARNNTTAQ